jgi:hypothetical protein
MSTQRKSSGRSLTKKPSSRAVDTTKYAGKTLVDLRKLREQEVQSLNFEEVKVIDVAIANHTIDNTEAVLTDSKAKLANELDAAFETYDARVAEGTGKRQSDERQLRATINTQFQDARSRHIDALADLETSRSLDVARSAQRPSATVSALRLKAMNQARGKAVEQAIRTRQEANQLLDQEIQDRQSDVRLRFNKLLKHRLAQQVAELHLLNDHLAKGLQDIQTAYEQNVEQRQQTLIAAIQESLRRTVVRAQQQLSKKEASDTVAEELKDFVRDKVVRDGRTYIYAGP